MILTNVRPTLVDISPFFLPVPQHHDLDESFVQACHQTRRDLPYELTNALSQFAAGDSSGALLLRGLPVGVVPSTPATPSAPTAKDRTSECTLLTLATLLGEPVGYAPEHGGKIVQNIVPVQATAAKQVSTSSNVTLDFHTETAFHPEKPHYLLLLCLRGDPTRPRSCARSPLRFPCSMPRPSQFCVSPGSALVQTCPFCRVRTRLANSGRLRRSWPEPSSNPPLPLTPIS